LQKVTVQSIHEHWTDGNINKLLESNSSKVQYTVNWHYSNTYQGRIQNLPKERGRTLAIVERKRITGSGGSRGRAPDGVKASPWSWKSFVHFHAKEGPKVKDLSERSSPCLSQTACRSHDQPPTFGQYSVGVATQSAHAWICSWYLQQCDIQWQQQ